VLGEEGDEEEEAQAIHLVVEWDLDLYISVGS